MRLRQTLQAFKELADLGLVEKEWLVVNAANGRQTSSRDPICDCVAVDLENSDKVVRGEKMVHSTIYYPGLDTV